MRILFAGGGTAGSVVPLLTLYTELKESQNNLEGFFIGTRKGDPEKKLLRGYGMKYIPIFGGKIRRYFDIRNATDLFLIIIGFFQSLFILATYNITIVVAAGGYISVPVICAAWLLRKKILIHQQDIRPSLSNKITAVFAQRITVTFEKSLQDFPRLKTVWTGNPSRPDIDQGSKSYAYKNFKLERDVPLLLVVGGGTGALGLNTVVNQSLPELIKICQIIHLTGAGKHVTGVESSRYHQYEFITEDMKDVLAASDLIVSRAGLSALTELSLLHKPIILVPMYKSHQEDNAEYFEEKGAAFVIKQQNFSPGILVNKVKELLADDDAREQLSKKIGTMIKPNATENIIQEITKLLAV